MSWATMWTEISNQTPCPALHCRNLVNRAWSDVQRQFLWSFLYGEAPIPSLVPIVSGIATVTLGSPYVGCDATLIAALNSLPLLLSPTTQCFRVGTGTIYRIVAYNNTNAPDQSGVPALSIQLDKLYADAAFGNIQGGNPPGGFQIFTCYVNAPTADFLWWESIKDPVNGFFVATTMTRETVDTLDPQRFQSGWPRAVVPFIVNPTPGNFYGYPMYEIWPAPLNNQVLVGTYFRSGLPFTANSDTVIPPLGEDVVIELAKMYSYEWCIANPDKVPKGDYRFLYGASQKRYSSLIDDYIRKDEAFSHRMLIDHAEPQFLDSLPWVSQKQAIGYFPT